jgi:hypothetical protein
MARRLRLVSATLALSAALVFSLVGVVSLGASLKAGGKVVSAKLTPKTTFTATEAKTTKLVCKFSPASKRVVFLLQMKKSSNWAKVRSTTKKGSIKTNTTTVNKLFGPNAVKVGQYRVKVSADANSLTRKFTVKTSPSTPSETDENVPPRKRGSGDGDSEEDPSDGEEDPGDGEEPPGGGTAVPSAFSKTNPINGATGVAQPVALSWSVSSDAISYQYCVDTTDNTVSKACHTPAYGGTGWVTVTSTGATVTGLTAGKTYYWQVHAYGGTYGTDADGGAWFSFIVA